MKFYNIRNTSKFMDAIRKCEGPVYLVSPEGGRMNLKDLAEQAPLLGRLGFSLDVRGDDGIEIIAERGADSTRLFRFMSEASHVA